MGSSNHEVQSTDAPALPIELLVIVAEILAGDLCFGTLASFNATCQIVHAETTSILYESTFWQYEGDLMNLVNTEARQKADGRRNAFEYVK